MGQTLKSYLREHYSDPTVMYIGSSSSFFYIGTALHALAVLPDMDKTFLNTYKEKLFKSERRKVSCETEITHLEKKVSELQRQVDNFPIIQTGNRPLSLEDNELLEMKKQCDKDLDLLKNNLIIRKDELELLISRINNFDRLVKTFIPFLDREIVYTFDKKKMPDELGIAIKITGYDDGKYWTKKEWIKDGNCVSWN